MAHNPLIFLTMNWLLRFAFVAPVYVFRVMMLICCGYFAWYIGTIHYEAALGKIAKATVVESTSIKPVYGEGPLGRAHYYLASVSGIHGNLGGLTVERSDEYANRAEHKVLVRWRLPDGKEKERSLSVSQPLMVGTAIRVRYNSVFPSLAKWESDFVSKPYQTFWVEDIIFIVCTVFLVLSHGLIRWINKVI